MHCNFNIIILTISQEICTSPLLSVSDSQDPYCTSKCPPKLLKYRDSCVNVQPPATYLLNEEYLDCNKKCSLCSQSAEKCTACTPGTYLLDQGSCVTSCDV